MENLKGNKKALSKKVDKILNEEFTKMKNGIEYLAGFEGIEGFEKTTYVVYEELVGANWVNVYISEFEEQAKDYLENKTSKDRRARIDKHVSGQKPVTIYTKEILDFHESVAEMLGYKDLEKTKWVIREEQEPDRWVPIFQSDSEELCLNWFNRIEPGLYNLSFDIDEPGQNPKPILSKLSAKKTQQNKAPQAPLFDLFKMIVEREEEISLKIGQVFLNSIDKSYVKNLKDNYQFTFSRISKLHLISGKMAELFEEITFAELFNLILITENVPVIPANQILINFETNKP